MRRVGLLGTGLIGASIGLGLRAQGWQVLGWDPNPEHRATAGRRGALDDQMPDVGTLLAASPDVLIHCGPVDAVIADLPDLVAAEALVMDVASVKKPVVEAATVLSRFVGTHPMAGREHSGPEAASAALFRGAAWVVVTDRALDTDLEEVEAVVRALGARPVRMTAAEHDLAVGVVSHLPQVVAASLLEEAAGHRAALELAAGSFRDLTRVAASMPAAWVQILSANRDVVAGLAREFGARLEAVATLIERGDREALGAYLAAARARRLALAPSVASIRVDLADRPGELARVGRALAASAVDVRDLQLRHATHGGGGVLTLSVRPGEAEALRAALRDEGLIVVD